MGKYEILDRLVDEGNGYLQTAIVLENNISKRTLARYTQDRKMERIAHGVYITEDTWVDDYYILYIRNRRIVYSHESALYLYGLMDREPSVTAVTVPKGYNSMHISKQGVRVIHSIPELYEIGIARTATVFGNEVPVYDRERTICDIIRGKKDIEIQTFQTALKEYMSSKEKNLGNLIRYSRAFDIEDEIRTYTEILL